MEGTSSPQAGRARFPPNLSLLLSNALQQLSPQQVNISSSTSERLVISIQQQHRTSDVSGNDQPGPLSILRQLAHQPGFSQSPASPGLSRQTSVNGEQLQQQQHQEATPSPGAPIAQQLAQQLVHLAQPAAYQPPSQATPAAAADSSLTPAAEETPAANAERHRLSTTTHSVDLQVTNCCCWQHALCCMPALLFRQAS
jgi:hypothetical protein